MKKFSCLPPQLVAILIILLALALLTISLIASSSPIVVPAAILSTLLIAVGWSKLTDYRNSGVIYGKVIRPAVPFPLKFTPEIELVDQNDAVQLTVKPKRDGEFTLRHVPEGAWKLRIISRWGVSVEKELSLLRKQKVELTEMQLHFDYEQVWKTERLSKVSQICSMAKTQDGQVWAVGFKTKGYGNTRTIHSRSQLGDWKEVIIPQMLNAERCHFIKTFKGSLLVVGSLGAGGVVSNNYGKTWTELKLPEQYDSVEEILELPDGSFLASVREWKRGSQPSVAILHYSNIHHSPKETLVLQQATISAMNLLSSGRVLIGTSSFTRGSSMLYSEDYGNNWEEATIHWPEEVKRWGPPLGVLSFFESHCGTVLAGTKSGKGWKGDWLPTGCIMVSETGGTSWKPQKANWGLGSAVNFVPTADKSVALLTTHNAQNQACFFTYDESNNKWREFLKTPVSGPTLNLYETEDQVFLYGHNSIASMDSVKLSHSFFTSL